MRYETGHLFKPSRLQKIGMFIGFTIASWLIIGVIAFLLSLFVDIGYWLRSLIF